MMIEDGGTFGGGQASGILRLVSSRCTCAECGDEVDEDDEDDLQYVESIDGRVCQACLDRYFTYAHGRHEQAYYREVDCVYCQTDGEWYYNSRRVLDRYDIVECSTDGKYYHIDDCIEVAGRWYLSDDLNIARLDVEYEGEEYARERDTVHTEDGRVIHEDAAAHIEWWDGNTYVLHIDDNPEDYLPEQDMDAANDPDHPINRDALPLAA